MWRQVLSTPFPVSRVVVISSPVSVGCLAIFEPLAKTGEISIPLLQQFPGVRVLATEPGEDIMDDFVFHQVFREVDWLRGTLVSFPNSVSWKDPLVLFADSTPILAIVGGRISRSRPASHVGQMRSGSILAM